jgi:lipopolysaccharide biosynthesis regulator YciM
MRRERDAAGAVETLNQILRDDQGFIPAYLLKAEIVAAGKSEKAVRDAIAVLKAGYRQRPHAELLLSGQRLLAAGGADGWQNVLKYYHKAISRTPDYWPARLLLAVFALEHQQAEEASRQLEELKKRSLADIPIVRLVTGELAYQRSHQLNQATDQVLMALRDADRPPFVFACSACGRYQHRWLARCPGCGSYDTLDLSPDVVALDKPG